MQPSAVNDHGEVVGQVGWDRFCSYNPPHQSPPGCRTKTLIRAFAWREGDLALLHGGAVAEAVNDSGAITGEPLGNRSCCVLWKNRAADPAAVPFGARAINARGVLVGGDRGHAVLWEAGRVTDLGTLGGRQSLATGINDAGQVIGYSRTASGGIHSFVWHDGKMTDLGTLFGDQSMPVAINARGEIVGNVFGPSPGSKPVAAYRWQNGKLTKIGRIHGDVASAVGINDRGQILVTIIGVGT